MCYVPSVENERLVLGSTLVTLAVVIWQTWLTRKAVKLAESTLKTTEEAVKDTQVVLQAQMMASANVVAHVKITLEGWEQRLTRVQERLGVARREADLTVLKAVAEQAEAEPEGLINRIMYEACPSWLKGIYEAGAQYYYEGQCKVRFLWNFQVDEPRVSAERDLGLADNDVSADGLRYALRGLRGARSLLDRLLPEFWLDAPASLSVERFFDR